MVVYTRTTAVNCPLRTRYVRGVAPRALARFTVARLTRVRPKVFTVERAAIRSDYIRVCSPHCRAPRHVPRPRTPTSYTAAESCCDVCECVAYGSPTGAVRWSTTRYTSCTYSCTALTVRSRVSERRVPVSCALSFRFSSLRVRCWPGSRFVVRGESPMAATCAWCALFCALSCGTVEITRDQRRAPAAPAAAGSPAAAAAAAATSRARPPRPSPDVAQRSRRLRCPKACACECQCRRCPPRTRRGRPYSSRRRRACGCAAPVLLRIQTGSSRAAHRRRAHGGGGPPRGGQASAK